MSRKRGDEKFQDFIIVLVKILGKDVKVCKRIVVIE